MTSNVKVEAEGAIRDLRETRKKAEKAVIRTEVKAAEVVAADAKERAPKLTGRLAGSVQSQVVPGGVEVKAGGDGVPYAGVIHFGWAAHNIKPQPFLYQAVDAKDAEVAYIAEHEMAKAVE